MGDLVGRADAIEAVGRVLDDAAAGRGSIITITGPAGVGRTALLQAVASAARAQGLLVLDAASGPFDLEAGLDLVRRALLPLVAERPDLVADGPATWAVPVFHPGAGEVDHVAVALGLVALVERAAEVVGPLAIVLDDVDRADLASLRVIAELSVAVADLPVSLVLSAPAVTARPGLARLAAQGSTVTLEPLGADSVASLAAERLGRPLEPAELQAVFASTLGLPGVLIPLLAAMADDPALPLDRIAPVPLPAQVASRLEDIGEPARSVAFAASVLGPDVRADVLAAGAGVPPDQVGGAVAELVDAGLFVAGARPSWAVPLLAQAARQLVGDGEAGLISLRAAGAMADAGDPPAQIATLLVRAPSAGEPWAAEALAIAAGAAEATGAPDVAKDLWLRQLEEPLDRFGRGWATASVARAEMHLGDPTGASRLDELAPQVDDAGLRSRVRFAAGRAFLWNAEADRAASSFRAAAVDARDAGEEEIARRSEAGELLAAAIGGLGDDRVATLAAALPERDGTASSSSQICARAMAALVRGAPAADVAALAREGTADDRLYVLPTSDFTAVTAAAFCLSLVGGPAEAVDALDRVIGVAHQVGQVSTVGTVSAGRATALLAAGRVSEAIDSAEAALGAGHAWPIERPAAAAVLAEARRLHGDLDSAARALAEHPVDPTASPLRTAEIQWLVVAARVALDAGQHSDSRALAERALRSGGLGAAVGADLVLAQALIADGSADEAAALLHRLVTEGTLRAAARHGTLQVLAGRLNGDLDQVADGVALLRSGASPIELIDGLTVLGHELLRLGRRAAAREVFREALGEADAIGTKGQAGVAIDGLRLAGGRPRRQAQMGVASLTPGEERICRLVASGRSNREVAEALFVSRKTVEYHLGNAFGKLGIARREELAAVLDGDQPAPARP